MIPEIKTPWWRDSIVFFVKASAWIAGPVILVLLIAGYAEKKWGTPPWVFFGLIMIAFLLSCLGVVREGLLYIKDVEKKAKQDSKKDERKQ